MYGGSMIKNLYLLTILCLFSSLSWSQDQDYRPTAGVAPIYPQEALMRGICGRVILQFTVSKNGSTKNIKVLESTNEIFEVSAKNSAMKYKYEPRIIQGQAIDVDDVKTAVTFKIDSEGDEEDELLCEAGLQGRTVEDLKNERHAAIKEAEEKQRLLEEEAEREADQRERQARRDEFFAKNESLHSDYKYGTKEKPIVKDFELADVGIYVYLDFGKGVKIRAVRGNLYCIDVFGDEVIAKAVEDKVIGIFSNDVIYRDLDQRRTPLNSNHTTGDNLSLWSEDDSMLIYDKNVKNASPFDRGYIMYMRDLIYYKYERPLESIHNRASFKLTRAVLEAGGIEECTFIPTKTVFE